MKDKKLLSIFFLFIAFVFALFCFKAYFGGLFMSEKNNKGILIGIICLITVIVILFIIFFPNESYKFSNIQEISETGITLIYKNKNEESKICFVKYYDKSNLNELLKNLKKGDIIYIPKNTPIDKEFFDSMNTFGVDYSIRFPNDSTKIEIIGK